MDSDSETDLASELADDANVPEDHPNNAPARNENRQSLRDRNKIAARKSRRRHKEYITNLQAREGQLAHQNAQLNEQVTQMQEELVGLRALAQQHIDCPISQAQGATAGAGWVRLQDPMAMQRREVGSFAGVVLPQRPQMALPPFETVSLPMVGGQMAHPSTAAAGVGGVQRPPHVRSPYGQQRSDAQSHRLPFQASRSSLPNPFRTAEPSMPIAQTVEADIAQYDGDWTPPSRRPHNQIAVDAPTATVERGQSPAYRIADYQPAPNKEASLMDESEGQGGERRAPTAAQWFKDGTFRHWQQ